MPRLYWVGALILAGLAFVGLGLYTQHVRTELVQAQEAARAAQEALKRTQSTLAYREKLRAATAREQASARASLSAATASAPAWAGTDVPMEVQNALCARIACAGPDGLREPETNDSP